MDRIPEPRVLVVDDDGAVRNALEYALRAEGYIVETCATAALAVDAAAKNRPQCMVIDYHLPDMDGIALANLLRARGLFAPLILITSNPDVRCRSKAAATGAVIVEKPLLGDTLKAQIETLIAASR